MLTRCPFVLLVLRRPLLSQVPFQCSHTTLVWCFVSQVAALAAVKAPLLYSGLCLQSAGIDVEWTFILRCRGWVWKLYIGNLGDDCRAVHRE